MATTAIGVDIGTRTIAVAEVRSSRGETTVTNFGGVELPEEVVREGEILDPAGIAEALRELVSTAKLGTRRIWLGVSNQRVVVRQIDLPAMDEKELRSSLRYQVQEYIPIPVEEAELDAHVVSSYTSDDGAQMQRLLLVAAHKDMVGAHVEAARQADLKPVGVDLNPFAVLRAIGNDSTFGEGNQVLVDVGAGITNIVVHEQGVPTFVRILVMGGEQITEALAAGLSISHTDAEAAKRQAVVGTTSDVAGQIVTEQADIFVDEVRNSLDYYQAQTGSSRLSGIVLTGGASMLGGLGERLASSVRLPVEVGNPFQRWRASDTVYSDEELAQVGPSLVTAVGLALGGLA